MAKAITELAKSVVARPVKQPNVRPSSLHWTKFDKPLNGMTVMERKATSERLADEMLAVIKDQEN